MLIDTCSDVDVGGVGEHRWSMAYDWVRVRVRLLLLLLLLFRLLLANIYFDE